MASPVIPALGFPLGTRLQMAWVEQGLAASLRPRKRPRSTLTPTIACRDGRPWLAFGTPGGDQQDQWQVPFFIRHVLHGLDLQAAIDAPAFHTRHAPASFWPREAKPGVVSIEGRFAPDVLQSLAQRGHLLELPGDWAEGRLSAVARCETPEGVMLKAAANPRGAQGYAVGR